MTVMITAIAVVVVVAVVAGDVFGNKCRGGVPCFFLVLPTAYLPKKHRSLWECKISKMRHSL